MHQVLITRVLRMWAFISDNATSLQVSGQLYIRRRGIGIMLMHNWIRILPFAALMPLAAAAQVPQSIPNGLPSWAYNIPDKVQPPSVKTAGPVTVPGSIKVYDSAQVVSSGNPPDWFPDEHPPAPRIVKDETGEAKMA
jgi:hypothetical protein